ncbi:MAG: TonB-dependent receptor domain-containing protein, partial [Phycisphaerae bacterium]
TGIDPETGAPPPYRITPLENLGGVYPISQRTGSYMARLDHEISAAHRLSLRLNYAHDKLSSFEAQNTYQVAGLQAFERTAALTVLDPTAVLTLNSVFSPRLLNDLRFSIAQRKFDITPNGLGAPVDIPGIAFLGQENTLPQYRTERHFHLNEAVTLAFSRHLLKAGGDLLLCPTTIDYQRLRNGLFTFSSQPAPGAPAGSPLLTPVQAYGLGLAANFAQIFGDQTADAGKLSVGLFLQDSWRLHSRFTLDWGMRYDVEKTDALEPGSQTMRNVFSRLSLRRSPPTDLNNFQPRLGFAWQALDEGRLSVRGSYGVYSDRLLNLATYASAAGDGVQTTRVILPGAAAAAVFQTPMQKLPTHPGGNPPTGLVAFSAGWQVGYTQQGNLVLSSKILTGLNLDVGYVWVRGVHLPRSRDVNPTDPARAAAFLAAGNPMPALLQRNFFRPVSEVAEAMAFEGSASSIFHGFRFSLRGTVTPGLSLYVAYALSKAISDADEIFPHLRAQDMRDFRSERGLALFDQRQRLVVTSIYQAGRGRRLPAMARNWSFAPFLELGTGRPVNILLGSDNNLDQDPSSDRPNVVPAGTPGSFATRFGSFAIPVLGRPGNLGRNAFVGPGYASLNLRVQRELAVNEKARLQLIAEAFNLMNRTNVRVVNPNFQHAGEPLAAFDPRQIQFAVRLLF